jgi:two-component system cell cycle sensor histidine kinase/response regulator CckA
MSDAPAPVDGQPGPPGGGGAVRETADLRTVLDSVRDVVYVVDVSAQKYTYVSRSVEDLLGISAEQFLAQGVEGAWQRVHAEDHQKVGGRYEPAGMVAVGDAEPALEFRLRHEDGSYRWVSETRTILRDDGGRPVTIVASVRDITDRREAERALAQERTFSDAVIDTAAMLIVVLDAEGRVVRFNRACEKLTGYQAQEVIGSYVWDALSPEAETPEVERLFSAALNDRAIVTYESHWLTRDGVARLISWSDARVTDRIGTPRYVVATGVDVTERRRLEEQLRRSGRMEAVGQIAGGIAHDFNNILTAIIGYVDLNLGDLPEDSTLHQDLLRIKRSAKRGADLTEQLLAFSREQAAEPKVIDLSANVSDGAKLVAHLLDEAVELRVNVTDEPLRVEMSPGQLERILVNLAVNARDAMPEGGTLAIATDRLILDSDFVRRHPSVQEGPHAVLTVTDTGVGMTAVVRERVFDPFFTTKDHGRGTGLGLSTVHGIAEQHGGCVDCESAPGEGTTFRVYLPLISDDATVTMEDTQLEMTCTGHETVLVVEDEERVREMASRVLRRFGYTVVAAEDGPEALTLLSEHSANVDLLLSDVVMPKMSGVELAQHARLMKPTLKLLFISGHVGRPGEGGRQASALSPLLRKPFSAAKLALKVREVLDAD